MLRIYVVLVFADLLYLGRGTREAAMIPDADKTLEDWWSLGKTSLDLVLNAHNLDTRGSIQTLAVRLIHFFNPPPSDDENITVATSTDS